MDRVDCIIVGAGVVGLAVARAIAATGREVIVVEHAPGIGSGISSRNSEVVHAGIYYDAHSLKAECCVRGKHLLYEFCSARGVAFKRSGKLVVATSAQDVDRLRGIDERARANGVSDLVWLSAEAARELEPELHCTGALFSPSSGIVDSHELMTALLADAEADGALLAVASAFAGATPTGSAWIARTDGDASYELQTDWIVNCAGLFAQQVARSIEGFPPAHIPQQWLAKGHYFSLAGRSPFSRLVYPLPADGGLGVHCTIDLGGQAKFGPDVEWLPRGIEPGSIDYAVDERRAESFYGAIRRYWPQLRDGALSPTYSGVRPKLSGPGQHALDFRIDGPGVHGCRGVVQLFGIESPGLTASMAIAERVAAIVGGAAPKR
ncbi:MAG TPA: NAD(P)/FAD-dependent oxidoreductase [Burkholderiaceae bacterium]|nr:NAD(P)/FAD-dependent oxidoreductase [Burkholderiaceae bacterium]